NVPRQDPQHVWQCDYKMVTPSEGGGSSNEMDYFNQFWYGGSGSAYGFRVRVETDHLLLLEVLGTSDGTTASKTWKVTKKYNRPGTTSHPYYRYLCKPVATANLSGDSVTLYEPDGGTARVVESAFKVYFGNVEQTTGWTISNTTGILTFTVAPPNGTVVKVSGQFDTPMRFFVNRFAQKADFPAEIHGLQMVEIMPAE